MSTFEDFENAPVGATAKKEVGLVAIREGDKTDYYPWMCTTYGDWLSNDDLAERGYTLERPVPTTAQEAFDLTWILAYPVKEGQVIPEGMRYIRRYQSGDLATFISNESWTPRHIDKVRTQDPLPDPEPYWLDAPAVLAHTDNDDTRRVWTACNDGQWASTRHTYTRHWQGLRDVTPLYPKEDVEPGKSDTPNDAPRYRTVAFRDDTPWGTRLGGDPA